MGYKILISILWLFWLLGFCSASTVSSLLDTTLIEDVSTSDNNWHLLFDLWSDFAGTYCIKLFDYDYPDLFYQFWIYNTSDSTYIPDNLRFSYFGTWIWNYVCSYTSAWYSYVYWKVNVWQLPFTYDLEYFVLDDLFYTNIPEMTSQECQSEYSLMPISSCNSEYCEMNNLCSVIWWSWSSTLYINDIRHESAPFIYVNIPEEFAWDYSTWEQEFTINVSWYNTDSDYIAWIINTQKSTPNDVDLNNIISWVLPLFVPWLVIILFIRFVFRFIKKIF